MSEDTRRCLSGTQLLVCHPPSILGITLIDLGDSVGDDLNAQERVLDDVASQYPSPALVLQHSTIDSAVDATYYGVDKLQQAGYQMVSVDTCLGSSGKSFV